MKRVPSTRVIINGKDVSGYVFACNLPRHPDAVESVDISIELDHLEVGADGRLTAYVVTEHPKADDRTKQEYALMWANGASFSEIYDLMEEQIRREVGDE